VIRENGAQLHQTQFYMAICHRNPARPGQLILSINLQAPYLPQDRKRFSDVEGLQYAQQTEVRARPSILNSAEYCASDPRNVLKSSKRFNKWRTLTGQHWGPACKRTMLSWEAGQVAA
jgi:hypothetical protein